MKLNLQDACEEGLSYLNSQESPLIAWQNCQRGDWMIWLIKSNFSLKGFPTGKDLCLAHCTFLETLKIINGDTKLVRKYADANANAYAYAKAKADANAYAYAYAYAKANAYAYADAKANNLTIEEFLSQLAEILKQELGKQVEFALSNLDKE